MILGPVVHREEMVGILAVLIIISNIDTQWIIISQSIKWSREGGREG